uniref:Uncharacterized protein n=1 Tax=Anguilla anguilla TaxID=7936 RepID=A0A0E9QQR7_ANGAN
MKQTDKQERKEENKYISVVLKKNASKSCSTCELRCTHLGLISNGTHR